MKPKPPMVATIGVFDGVHLGHQALLRETAKMASRLRSKPMAFTFQDHPLHVLRGGSRIPFLISRQKAYRLLKTSGLSKVQVLSFTPAFSRLSPEKFIQRLQRIGRLKGIVVGENFRFGRNAQGDVELLEKLGKKAGFKVKALKAVRVRGQVVSSSRIRKYLAEGKTSLANRMLGWTYNISGEVVHGKHLGHKIGFPTANLSHIREFLPKDGVYACGLKLSGMYYKAGMNLGKRPTFKDDDHHRQAEVHILHYNRKIYGKKLRISLLEYLRPEMKFKSSDLLARQIKKDLDKIKKIHLPL